MELRPYQETALQAMREALREHRSVLLVLPCGGGKGTITTQMVEGSVERGRRVTFSVKGIDLVDDMSRRVSRCGLPHGVLRGSRKRELEYPVQVASVATLHRMKEKPPADLLILDEARTFSNESGRALAAMYPDAKVVGLDATPVLLGGQGLGTEAGGIFESIVLGPDEQELIDLGYLCPSIVFGTGEPPDVTGIGKVGPDFNPEQLAEACNRPKLIGDIVEHWLREGRGLKTVAFGANRVHALAIRDAFVAAGIEWEYVDGETPSKVREEIYARLDHGTLMGISNVGIAGFGWDHPIVSCIISGAPTLSLSKWRQQLGRASRIYPGKTHFVVLDHAGNTVRHWPYGFFETPPRWTLAGISRRGKKAERDNATPISMCKRPVRLKGDAPASFHGVFSDDGKYMLPCFAYFQTGPRECPKCGLALISADRKQIETEAGELKNLAHLRAAAVAARSVKQTAHDEKMRRRYLQLVEYTLWNRKKNGEPYSPNWPLMQFRLEFNRFPAKALREEGKALQEASVNATANC